MIFALSLSFFNRNSMETAQLILQLAGHQELLKAELLQIDSDIKGLAELSKRYPDQKELFLTPQSDLRRVKKEKEAEEKEIRLHLQCYDLHRPTGEKILAKVIKAEKQRSMAASSAALAASSNSGGLGMSGCSHRLAASAAASLGAAQQHPAAPQQYAAASLGPSNSRGLPPPPTTATSRTQNQQHANPMALSSISSSASTPVVRPSAASGVKPLSNAQRLASSGDGSINTNTATNGRVPLRQQQHHQQPTRDVVASFSNSDNRPLYGAYTKPAVLQQQQSSTTAAKPLSSNCSTSRAATAGRQATDAHNGSFNTRDDASSSAGEYHHPDDSEYIGNDDRYYNYRAPPPLQQQQRIRANRGGLATTNASANAAYRHYDDDDFSAASSSGMPPLGSGGRFGGGLGSTSMDDSSVQ